MKKELLILASSAVLLVVACDNNSDEPKRDGYPVTVSAVSTRAALDGTKVIWEATDRIFLSNSNNTGAVLTLSGGAGTAAATFTGTLGNEPPATDTYYAFNAFSGNTCTYDGTLSAYVTSFPAAQSSSQYLPVMVGMSEDQPAGKVSMNMKNVGAMFQFALTGDESLSLSSIVISADEVMAGDFYVTDYESPVPMFTSSEKSITYTVTEPVLIGEDPSYFSVQIPNITFASGIHVTFNAADGTVVEKTIGGEGLSVVRNKLYEIPAATFVKPTDEVVTVSDSNLQAFLVSNFDTNSDGVIRKSEAMAVEEIVVSDLGIGTLEGIKEYGNLKKLVADHNILSSVDLAGMTALEELNISFSKAELSSISLDGCTSLKTLLANDPLNSVGLVSFSPVLPALETLNINLWHNTQTLGLSGCPKLKWLDACQLYAVKKLDFTANTALEHCFIPDIFECTEFKVSSTNLTYLGIWNAKKLATMDLSACTALVELVANDCGVLENLTVNSTMLKILNVNLAKKLKYLDLSKSVNLESLNAIQLYECTNLILPSSCANLTYAWLADLLVAKELTFTKLPANARILIWGCTNLETFNYESAQSVIGWNYGDDPAVVTDVWTVPGNNIKYFNIVAPNVKTLFISNLHAVESLDLSGCPNVEDVTMPDMWVMSSFDVSSCSKLHRLLIWNSNALTSLDLSGCAATMSEVNTGTGDGKCDSLQKILLRSGQTISNVIKEDSVSIEYK